MRTILITGASRGFGRALAEAFDPTDDVSLVLAVRDVEAGRAVAKALRVPASVVHVDMGSRASIDALAATWTTPLYALIHNAGIQNVGPTRFTDDGVEATLAVNYLGPLRLTWQLLPHLKGAVVMGIGSGTHDPDHPLATKFGFRGGRFTSVDALARGEVEADARSDRQRGMDRYATSKLLLTASAVALSTQHPDTTFVTFDPGAMPGTGLARSSPWFLRVLWHTVLPLLVPLLPDASTPRRSASSARSLLLRDPLTPGQVYGFDGKPARHVAPQAKDPGFARSVLEESGTLLQNLSDAIVERPATALS